MALLEIVKHPDSRLERECETVTEFSNELHVLLDNMYETMVESDGVGIAAPQVGVCKKAAIVDLDDDEGTIEMMNPSITFKEGKDTDVEGCLSFPGLYGEVERTDSIVLKAQDRDGKWYKLEADGYLSRAIQHEVDHLNGILFTSKVTRYITEEELEGYGEE
ncbi:peptide deformylase [Jeotgalibacillus proteolyticus]|uniref:Peptide deformylase n=1 Tax=Jeotgalibacillus proteolyticus TaxID=2082395 RepID=A0A2S5GGW0_9BACL|nr:peptide deformylase [Jeotgalibacillus proteolyticus]PPA72103.1 peptide deformylase [Jeotgalibacillus proteolyticus]